MSHLKTVSGDEDLAAIADVDARAGVLGAATIEGVEVGAWLRGGGEGGDGGGGVILHRGEGVTTRACGDLHSEDDVGAGIAAADAIAQTLGYREGVARLDVTRILTYVEGHRHGVELAIDHRGGAVAGSGAVGIEPVSVAIGS